MGGDGRTLGGFLAHMSGHNALMYNVFKKEWGLLRWGGVWGCFGNLAEWEGFEPSVRLFNRTTV